MSRPSLKKKVLFQLCFFVDHVLASNRIILRHFHLTSRITFVLRGGVEVTGTGSRCQFDFFTDTFRHGELLRFRRGRGDPPKRLLCRSCQSYAVLHSLRVNGPSGFRFRPRIFCIEGWA